MDPVVLLERFVDAPLEPLLESLRESHRQRDRDPEWLPGAAVLASLRPTVAPAPAEPASLRPTVAPAPAEPAPWLVRAVDWLRQLDRVHASRPATGAGPTQPVSYDAVREHFRSHESELARRASLTGRLLDQIRRGDPVDGIPPSLPLQQQLRIVCGERGESGGRFVVANETALAREIRCAIAEPPEALAGAQLRFRPARARVAAGATRIVELEVDLARSALAAGEWLELRVELNAGQRLLGRLWVELAVVATDAEADERGAR